MIVPSIGHVQVESPVVVGIECHASGAWFLGFDGSVLSLPCVTTFHGFVEEEKLIVSLLVHDVEVKIFVAIRVECADIGAPIH